MAFQSIGAVLFRQIYQRTRKDAQAEPFDSITLDLDSEDRLTVNFWLAGRAVLSYGPYCVLPGDRLMFDQLRGLAQRPPAAGQKNNNGHGGAVL